jgi:hypothetical protein
VSTRRHKQAVIVKDAAGTRRVARVSFVDIEGGGRLLLALRGRSLAAKGWQDDEREHLWRILDRGRRCPAEVAPGVLGTAGGDRYTDAVSVSGRGLQWATAFNVEVASNPVGQIRERNVTSQCAEQGCDAAPTTCAQSKPCTGPGVHPRRAILGLRHRHRDSSPPASRPRHDRPARKTMTLNAPPRSPGSRSVHPRSSRARDAPARGARSQGRATNRGVPVQARRTETLVVSPDYCHVYTGPATASLTTNLADRKPIRIVRNQRSDRPEFLDPGRSRGPTPSRRRSQSDSVPPM